MSRPEVEHNEKPEAKWKPGADDPGRESLDDEGRVERVWQPEKVPAGSMAIPEQVEHPDRAKGKPDLVLRPRPAKDPAVAERAEDRADARGALRAAAHVAANAAGSGSVKRSVGEAASAATIFRDGMKSTALHLQQIDTLAGGGDREAEAYVDAAASIMRLMHAAGDQEREWEEAAHLRATFDIVSYGAPPMWAKLRPRTIAAATAISRDNDLRRGDRDRALVGAIRSAGDGLRAAVDRFDDLVNATDEVKRSIFQDAATAATSKLVYVERALAAGELGLAKDDPEVVDAIDNVFPEVQRFVLWANHGKRIDGPIAMIVGAATPLFARAGKPLLATRVEATAVEKTDAQAKEFANRWDAVFHGQMQALEELADRPEPEVDGGSNALAILKRLASIALGTVIGGVAGAAGAVLAAAVEGSAKNAGRNGAVGNATETLVELGIDAILDAVIGQELQHGKGLTRRDFFYGQSRAINKSMASLQNGFIARMGREALRSSRGAETLATMIKAIPELEDVKTRQLQESVQRWAVYQASIRHGVDDHLGGVDLTGVGASDSSWAADSATGVLSLTIDLAESRPVIGASIRGLRADDAAILGGIPVRQLSMPVMFHFTMRNAGYVMVGRNDGGTLWLRDADERGRKELAELVDGKPTSAADQMAGVENLVASIADEAVPKVVPPDA